LTRLHGAAPPDAAERALDEFELIARHFAPLAKGFPGAWDLLDDAAVIAPLPGHDLVAKTDAIVGGVHFLPDDPPDLVARKALRVNLSDLAAKGAIPRAYMVDLMVPKTTPEAWIASFARGLGEDQERFGMHLIGGDTDSTPGPVAIAIMAFGDVPSGRMIRRAGARAGDTVFVTGTVGDAALGLQALSGNLPHVEDRESAFLVSRYRLPEPRVALGPRLVGLASAALDVSDGLVADLQHLCDVSGVDAVIEAARVPLSTAARLAVARRAASLAGLLGGGDDYEILFTAPATAAETLAELAGTLGVPITAIGRVDPPTAGRPPRATVLGEKGQPLPLERAGWTHF
jgi:thiamine-monophosphate kinase